MIGGNKIFGNLTGTKSMRSLKPVCKSYPADNAQLVNNYGGFETKKIIRNHKIEMKTS